MCLTCRDCRPQGAEGLEAVETLPPPLSAWIRRDRPGGMELAVGLAVFCPQTYISMFSLK